MKRSLRLIIVVRWCFVGFRLSARSTGQDRDRRGHARRIRRCRPSRMSKTGKRSWRCTRISCEKFSSNPAAVAYGNWQISSRTYQSAGDLPKALEYGDKALAGSPRNLDILVSQAEHCSTDEE